jgi:hypothetical protein
MRLYAQAWLPLITITLAAALCTGTLVRYSDDSNDCSPVKLRFDARRSTALRLSQVNLEVGQLDAIISTPCIPSGKN